MKSANIRPLSFHGALQLDYKLDTNPSNNLRYEVSAFPVFNVMLNPGKVYAIEDLNLSVLEYDLVVNSGNIETNGAITPVLIIGLTSVVDKDELFKIATNRTEYIPFTPFFDNIPNRPVIADKTEVTLQYQTSGIIKIPYDNVLMGKRFFPIFYSELVSIVPFFTDVRLKSGTENIFSSNYANPSLNKVFIKAQNYKYLQFTFGVFGKEVEWELLDVKTKTVFSLNANLIEYIP